MRKKEELDVDPYLLANIIACIEKNLATADKLLATFAPLTIEMFPLRNGPTW